MVILFWELCYQRSTARGWKKKVFSFEWNPVPGAFSAVKRSSCCHYLFIFSSWLSFLFFFFKYLLLLLKDSAFGSSVSDYSGTKINITLRNKSLTVGLNTGWKERINMTADHQFITSLHTCSFLEGRNSLLQASWCLSISTGTELRVEGGHVEKDTGLL